MEILTLNRKKGQTLVETVVALSILSIVLVGTIKLVTNIVTLVLSSRNETQAVALSEKGLAVGVQLIASGTKKLTDTSVLVLYDADRPFNGCTRDGDLGRACEVTVYNSSNSAYDVDDKDPNVYEIVSKVSWVDRSYSGRKEVVLKQLVKKPE
jgi:Tfp pilus assembly protein PilV